jgi:hypothetical protein
MRRLVLILCFALASLSARADFLYSFTDFGAQTFSFSAPSLITDSQSIAITPFTIQDTQFTQAYASVSGSNVCFYFASIGLTGGSCNAAPSGSTGAYFYGFFLDATTVGTQGYGYTYACTFNGANASDLILQTLTISGTSSTVPDPSSLILLGSGLLGVVGVMRRKLLP